MVGNPMDIKRTNFDIIGGFYSTIFQILFIFIENVKGDHSGECGFYAVGIENYPLKDIRLKNIQLRSCKTPYIMRNVENVTFENVSLGGIILPKNPVETKESKLNSY